MVSKQDEEFLTPASTINEAAFNRMCGVLDLSEDEQRLVRMAISTYETAKRRHDGQH
jgi:hypothetical protein